MPWIVRRTLAGLTVAVVLAVVVGSLPDGLQQAIIDGILFVGFFCALIGIPLFLVRTVLIALNPPRRWFDPT